MLTRLFPRRRCFAHPVGDDNFYTMNIHATRKRNIFNPTNKEPFALSRSKIDLFFQCRRCFYLDRRLGVSPPRGFPFNLNDAVDLLLKKEFDVYRAKQEPHPLVAAAGLSLVPMQHKDLAVWRNPFEGVRYYHEPSNFIVFGGVDDVWHDVDGVVTVVDYKATSKEGEVTIDAKWQDSYKRQLEVYQWLFRNNGFTVSDTGYFVYANGDRSEEKFGDVLRFKTKLIPYVGSADWIEDTLLQAREVLVSDEIPSEGRWCDFCPYRNAAGKSFRSHMLSNT